MACEHQDSGPLDKALQPRLRLLQEVGVHRTDDAVFVHIIAGNWRDIPTKRALYRAIADRLSKAPGLRREDVQVIISSNERADWSLGNGVASYLKDAEIV